MRQPWQLKLGALLTGSSARFTVWAPSIEHIDIKLFRSNGQSIPMSRESSGYFEAEINNVQAGDRYLYILDGQKERPDPVSRSQPDGVHGASQIVDPSGFHWSDHNWKGLPLERLILYELHVGTWTEKGTFDAIIPHLAYLRELGITAVELMPIAQFSGSRNWGYDGVGLYAPHSSYGGPDGLKSLVDACHRLGLAVILDVVYNHVGPEGNYLQDFGPYFTDRYRTPWGSAVNYDGPESDQVRRYVLDNALYWITEYHFDGLRLDAVHGIYDFGALHVLKELADLVHDEARRLGRTVLLIAESDLNDNKIISPTAEGGYGLDAQWSDDFHHALHAVLTGERAGYYEDFGKTAQIGIALQDGFVYTGQHSPHRRRRHGSSVSHRPPQQLVICAQNHDQIGNRAMGERLSTLVPWEALKVAAAAVLLAPQTPLLFMGEEYGETAPFLYFVDHSDAALNKAVRDGRRKEFAAFGWTEVPDPLDRSTFERSRLHLDSPEDERQSALLAWYRRLIHLRQTFPAYVSGALHDVQSYENEQLVTIYRRDRDGHAVLVILGFNKMPTTLSLQAPKETWTLHTASWAREFGGKDDDIPRTLVIPSAGASWVFPAYGVAIYTAAP